MEPDLVPHDALFGGAQAYWQGYGMQVEFPKMSMDTVPLAMTSLLAVRLPLGGLVISLPMLTVRKRRDPSHLIL